MAREIEDLVQATVTSTGTGAFVVSATPIAGYRTPAQAHTVGATFEYIAKAGNDWEVGLGTLVDATHISRAPIRSSNGNALVNFTTAPTLYETVSGDYLRGTDPSTLPVASTAGTGDWFLLFRADGTAARILVANAGGSTTSAPVDNPPTLSALSASATGATTATGSATTNETGGTIYWLFSASATATAVAVKAGSSKAVTAIGAQTLPGTGLSASTPYYLHVLHRDTANQDSAVLSLGAPFTTQAAGTPAPTVTGVSVSPSTANVNGGGTVQLSATVAGTNSPSQGVNWTIAGGGSVSTSGLVTAPAGATSAQTLTATATSQQDSTKSGTAMITVAALASALTVNTPSSPQVVGTPFPVTGTWSGVQPTALDYQLSDGGGSWVPAVSPTFATTGANAGTYSFSVNPATASTGRTITVRDHNATTVVSAASGPYVVNAATSAPNYILTPDNNGFPTAPATMTQSGGQDKFSGGNVNIFVKTADGLSAPAAGAIKFVWGKSSVVPPISYSDTTVAIDTSGTKNGNKETHTNSVVVPSRLGNWPTQNPQLFGLHSSGASFTAWGTPGNWYLWVLTADGFAKAYDNNTGTPIAWVLT